MSGILPRHSAGRSNSCTGLRLTRRQPVGRQGVWALRDSPAVGVSPPPPSAATAGALSAQRTVKRTVMAYWSAVLIAATTFAPLAIVTPLASSLSPLTTSGASDFSVPLSTVSLPLMPVGTMGLP